MAKFHRAFLKLSVGISIGTDPQPPPNTAVRRRPIARPSRDVEPNSQLTARPNLEIDPEDRPTIRQSLYVDSESQPMGTNPQSPAKMVAQLGFTMLAIGPRLYLDSDRHVRFSSPNYSSAFFAPSRRLLLLQTRPRIVVIKEKLPSLAFLQNPKIQPLIRVNTDLFMQPSRLMGKNLTAQPSLRVNTRSQPIGTNLTAQATLHINLISLPRGKSPHTPPEMVARSGSITLALRPHLQVNIHQPINIDQPIDTENQPLRPNTLPPKMLVRPGPIDTEKQ